MTPPAKSNFLSKTTQWRSPLIASVSTIGGGRPIKPMKLLARLLSCLVLVCAGTGCAINQPPKLKSDPSQPTPNRTVARKSLNELRGGKFFSYRGKDGAELGAFRHFAAGRRSEIVIALHGLQTHAGWMAPVAKRLAAEGMEVWCPDRRGSGVNAAGHFSAGDLAGWRVWVDDVEALVDTAAREAPGVPIVLVGYSWGGVMAAAYLEKIGESGPVKQAVVLAPGWATKKPGPIGAGAVLCASALLPMKRIYLPTPDDVAVTGLGKAVLWEDEVMMRQVTLRYLRQMSFMQLHTNRNLSAIRVPVTVLLAGKDALIDNPKVEALAQHLGPALAGRDTIRGAGHLLVQEKPREVAAHLLRAIKRTQPN